MLSLTLRSSKDGRFLARVVDRDGVIFVLDFGDNAVIADATQRVTKGFSMWRYGTLVHAAAQSREMLLHLAEFYASEGSLVSLEEPNWSGREAPYPDEEASVRWSGMVVEGVEPQPDDTEETDLISADELAALGVDRGQARRVLWAPDLDETDQPTELAPIPIPTITKR